MSNQDNGGCVILPMRQHVLFMQISVRDRVMGRCFGVISVGKFLRLQSLQEWEAAFNAWLRESLMQRQVKARVLRRRVLALAPRQIFKPDFNISDDDGAPWNVADELKTIIPEKEEVWVRRMLARTSRVAS